MYIFDSKKAHGRPDRQTDIKSQKACGQPDGWRDGNIILSLRGFETVTYGCMNCAQLQSTQMINKKLCGQRDRYTEINRDRDTEIQRYRETDRTKYILNWTPLGSFRPQCGDKRIVTLDLDTEN